jgi:uncharacterized protein (DUF1015 family)
MVEFIPFRGLRPQLREAEPAIVRVSPPYDVIGKEQLLRLKSFPHNVTQITLGADESGYANAGRLLRSWVDEGILALDAEPAYYIYEQELHHEGRKKLRRGVMGALAASGYAPGGVIPHEETFPKVKEDRLALLHGVEAHCESIFGIARIDPLMLEAVAKRAKEVFACADEQQVRHSLRIVTDKADIKGLQEALAKETMLIADGHHRYETACTYAKENAGSKAKQYVLATIVPSEDRGLVVEPTHRVIAGLRASPAELASFLGKELHMEKVPREHLAEKLKATDGKGMGLVTRDASFLCLPKHVGREPLWEVDTYLCEKLVMEPLLAKEDAATIIYEHQASVAVGKIDKGTADAAVLLSPPTMDVIWKVAMAGLKMPKKSTYFWPKMWSGLLYYPMW